MRFALPLAFSLFAAQVLADSSAILAVLASISNATITLNNTLNTYPSNSLLAIGDAIPLHVDSSNLLNEINAGTAIASQNANLTLLESIGVAQSTQSLSTTVSSTLQNLMSAKAKLDKLLVISPVVLAFVKLQKAAADKFGTALVSKVPSALQGVAQGLLAPIDQAFNATIVYYT